MQGSPPNKHTQGLLRNIGKGLLQFLLVAFLSVGTLIGIAVVTLTLSIMIGILAFTHDWNPLWTLVPIAIALNRPGYSGDSLV